MGIGTTSPYAPLSVTGNAAINGNETVTGTVTLPALATPAGSFVAVDANGNMIATSSPATSVSNVDGTLTISQVSGAVTASLNLAHANTFSALQQFNANASTTQLTTTGNTYLATSGGKVGIGTTSPYALLSIDANGTGLPLASPVAVIKQQTSGTGDLLDIIMSNGGKKVYIDQNGQLWLGILQGASGTFTAYTNGTTALTIQSLSGGGQTANIMTVGQNGLGTFDVFNPQGNLGVGTTTPWATLSVSTSTAGTGTLPLFAVASSTNATLFNVLGNGNVGIGTTSPYSQFAVQSASGNGAAIPYMVFASTTAAGANVAQMIFSHDAFNNFVESSYGAAILQFVGTGNEGLGGSYKRFGLGSHSGSSQAAAGHFVVTGPTDVNMNGYYADYPGAVFNFGELRQRASSPLATINDFKIFPSIEDYSTGSTTLAFNTIASSTALYIAGTPTPGPNANITNTYGLFIDSTTTPVAASTTNSYGLAVLASSGAAHNYAAEFLNGNVGIGTTSPYGLLSIDANGSGLPLASPVAVIKAQTGGTGDVLNVNLANGTTALKVDQYGNISGNTSFAVTSSAGSGLPPLQAAFLVKQLGNSNNLVLTNSSAQTTGNMLLVNNVNTSMYLDGITSTGNLVSGTSTTPFQLAVQGRYNNNADLFDVGSSTNANGTATTSLFRITAAGSVGVGTTSPWRTLAVNGTLALSGLTSGSTGNTLCLTAGGEVTSGASCTVSSQRFKHDIAPLAQTAGLGEVLALQPVSFVYNQGYGDNGAATQVGFIAEQAQKIDPRLVPIDASGQPGGFFYQNYTAILTKAIQQLEGGYSLNNLSANAASTIASMYAGVAAPAISVDSTGNVGIGNSSPTSKLSVNGTITATAYVVPGAGQNFVATYSSLVLGSTTATSALTADGSGVDLLKLGLVTMSGVQQLAVQTTALASTTVSLSDKLATLTTRVSALEAGAAAATASLQSASSTAQSDLLASTTSVLAGAFQNFGMILQNGVAQFNTLVVRDLVFSKDTSGASAAGSGKILAGNTTVQITNQHMLAQSQVSVTLTSPMSGSWYVTNKKDGSFQVTLSSVQGSDVTFDYLIVQTQGQIATSTPDTTGNPFSWLVNFLAPTSTQTTTAPAPLAPVESGTSLSAGAPVGVVSGGANTSGIIVTLKGAAAISLTQGALFIDPGATAVDASSTDITSSIVVTGTVDTNTSGMYTVTYTAKDAAGNTGNASRVVTVSGSVIPAASGGSSTPVAPITPPATTTTTPAPTPAPTTSTPSATTAPVAPITTPSAPAAPATPPTPAPTQPDTTPTAPVVVAPTAPAATT